MEVVVSLTVEVVGAGVGVEGDGVTGLGVVAVVVEVVVVGGTGPPELLLGACVGAGVGESGVFTVITSLMLLDRHAPFSWLLIPSRYPVDVADSQDKTKHVY